MSMHMNKQLRQAHEDLERLTVHYTLEQLGAARVQLGKQLRQARSDSEYLTAELSRRIVNHSLGEAAPGELSEIRQQLAAANQILEEIPGAIVKMDDRIQVSRLETAEVNRTAAVQATLTAYFEARDEIISNPVLADKGEPAGRLRSLASQLDRDVANNRLEKRSTHFDNECRTLIDAAMTFAGIPQKEQFTFGIMITE